MNVRPHRYAVRLAWVGAERGPTASYETYSRDYTIASDGKPALRGSADAHFRGDRTLYNPEDLLVAALSACHLLSYLAACARRRIEILSYEDDASGEMTLIDGKIRFREVVLRPRVTLAAGADAETALKLHAVAHGECFIANSVNFPVLHDATVTAAPA